MGAEGGAEARNLNRPPYVHARRRNVVWRSESHVVKVNLDEVVDAGRVMGAAASTAGGALCRPSRRIVP